MPKPMLQMLLLMLLLMLSLAFASAEPGSTTVDVDAPNGPILGRSHGRVSTFLGIPYAEPPLGRRRWQPPAPKQPWSETFDGTKGPGPACYQRKTPAVGELSEDCLHLHIWAPSKRSQALRPVLVYLHGGSLVEGSAVAIQAAYGGSSTLADPGSTTASVLL